MAKITTTGTYAQQHDFAQQPANITFYGASANEITAAGSTQNGDNYFYPTDPVNFIITITKNADAKGSLLGDINMKLDLSDASVLAHLTPGTISATPSAGVTITTSNWDPTGNVFSASGIIIDASHDSGTITCTGATFK